jgi:hypothetical protein
MSIAINKKAEAAAIAIAARFHFARKDQRLQAVKAMSCTHKIPPFLRWLGLDYGVSV